MQRRQMLGILGSFALAIGAFAPVVSLANVERFTYFRAGNGVMLAIALVSLAIALRNQCAWLLPAGLTSLAMTITTFRTARSLMFASAPADGVQGQIVQVDWGLWILLAGALLLFASAFMPPTKPVGDAAPEVHLPRLVVVATLVIAVVLMGTVWLAPTGTFVFLQQ